MMSYGISRDSRTDVPATPAIKPGDRVRWTAGPVGLEGTVTSTDRPAGCIRVRTPSGEYDEYPTNLAVIEAAP